eukprot:TRINITY_DN48119_c0_g1_i1.p1 TRINITY_DN48119_c0_g1~~TRINITY_DN48119_c0_g1_i1.p1  ORF type:complete len:253 (+),score=62.85 TRINITY_DN48119_c0_g1_i1:193-951(+)
MSPELLVFVVDMTSRVWGDAAQLGNMLDDINAAVQVFCLGRGNRFAAVIGVGDAGAAYLPQSRGHREEPWEAAGEGLRISHALSKGLCFVNRHSKGGACDTAFALLLGSPTHSDEHTPVMNAAFVASTLGVRLDVVWLPYVTSEVDLTPRHAAASTGGCVLTPPCTPPEGGGAAGSGGRTRLLSLLMTAFVAPRNISGGFQPPQEGCDDTRAMCRVTKQLLDIGNVCSVCFSIFSTSVDVSSRCPTCGVEVS